MLIGILQPSAYYYYKTMKQISQGQKLDCSLQIFLTEAKAES